MMNSQESSATGYSPHELFMARAAWVLHAPDPEDSSSAIEGWVKELQDKVDKAKAMLQRVRRQHWNKKHKHRVPATYQESDSLLLHHSRLPAWARSTGDDPLLWALQHPLSGWPPHYSAVFSPTTMIHGTYVEKNGS